MIEPGRHIQSLPVHAASNQADDLVCSKNGMFADRVMLFIMLIRPNGCEPAYTSFLTSTVRIVCFSVLYNFKGFKWCFRKIITVVFYQTYRFIINK